MSGVGVGSTVSSLTQHVLGRPTEGEAIQESTAHFLFEQVLWPEFQELNAALIGDVTLDAILARITERVVTVYGAAGCRVLVPDGEGALVVGAAAGKLNHRDPENTEVAQRRMKHEEPTEQCVADSRGMFNPADGC